MDDKLHQQHPIYQDPLIALLAILPKKYLAATKRGSFSCIFLDWDLHYSTMSCLKNTGEISVSSSTVYELSSSIR